MTLAQIIKLKTDDGLAIVNFLMDVMQDKYKDFQICHRLQAAKLLTTYGNEDAPDFIDDNPQEPQPNRNRRRPRRQSKFDEELARVIREDTEDGRSIARFLVNVMVGEIRSFRPHHRMSAARELLDRGFGKSARKETPTPVVPAEERHPVLRYGAGTQRRQGWEALTPGNPDPAKGPNPTPTVHPEPVEGPKPTPTVRPEPVEGPKPVEADSLVRPEPVEGPEPSTDDTNEIREIPKSHESEFRQIRDDLPYLHPDDFEEIALDLPENIGHVRNYHTHHT